MSVSAREHQPLLPSTLTLLIGLRVTHSWGCVYVCVNVGKVVKKGRPFLTTLPTLTHTYLHTDPSFQVYVSKC